MQRADENKQPGRNDKIQELDEIVKISSSKDINPQFIRGEVIESAVNTYTEAAVSTPNIAEAGFAMEILKVFIEINVDAMGDDQGVEVHLADRSRTVIGSINTPGVIAKLRTLNRFTTSGRAHANYPVEYDLTDSGGNGYLYGKKEIFAAVFGTGQTVPITGKWALLYRIKKVSVTELVGLMQD